MSGFKLEDLLTPKRLADEFVKHEQLIADLEARLGQAVKTLEFYGDTENYNKEDGSIHDMQPRGLEQKLWKVLDFGDRARAALESIRRVNHG
jgi:hypothetical protein